MGGLGLKPLAAAEEVALPVTQATVVATQSTPAPPGTTDKYGEPVVDEKVNVVHTGSVRVFRKRAPAGRMTRHWPPTTSAHVQLKVPESLDDVRYKWARGEFKDAVEAGVAPYHKNKMVQANRGLHNLQYPRPRRNVKPKWRPRHALIWLARSEKQAPVKWYVAPTGDGYVGYVKDNEERIALAMGRDRAQVTELTKQRARRVSELGIGGELAPWPATE